MCIRRGFLLTACICLFAGCKLAPPKGESQHSILDQQFFRPDVQLTVQEAERDLPGDKWVTAIPGATKSAGTWNQTRRDREVNLADKLLKEIQPQFRQKSVPDLLASLKTYPWSSDMVLTGVASYYFDYGNRMIIEELRKRPTTELNSLGQHVNDKRKLYQENGPYSSVGGLCEVLLGTEAKAVK
jgi:hypothetical protein